MVTLETIAVELGRPTPSLDSVEGRQWQAWIDEALFLIGRRLTLADLDEATVDYVVKHAVVAMARNPDSATTVDVAVDDGRVSRRYSSSAGHVSILDAWWAMLDPDLAGSSGVGSTQLYGDTGAPTPNWWVTTTSWVEPLP
jgi:hypothetical protein